MMLGCYSIKPATATSAQILGEGTKMETEASFHGFAAKLSAGSLARVGFGQSDVTAGKQRAGAWGGVLVSGSPAVGVWWAVAVFLHPRLQLLLEHSSLDSRNFSPFVPSDLQLVIASLCC